MPGLEAIREYDPWRPRAVEETLHERVERYERENNAILARRKSHAATKAGVLDVTSMADKAIAARKSRFKLTGKVK